MKAKEPWIVFGFTFTDDESLKNIWWSFLEWLGEYEKFGIIPGLCIDAKALANVKIIPPVCLNGRTSNENSGIYAMCFLE